MLQRRISTKVSMLKPLARGRITYPTQLIVMVNGITVSAQDWRYAAKQFVKVFPEDVIVHCSECNSSMLTFHGVDVMGKRLADEVISVVRSHPNLQMISFVAHSLVGLVSRYAAACLYQQDFTRKNSKENGDYMLDESKESFEEKPPTGKITGLEQMNFITSATPHLGSPGGTNRFLFSVGLKPWRKLHHMLQAQGYLVELRRDLPKDARYTHIVHEDPSNLVNPQDVYSLEAKVARIRRREMEGSYLLNLK